MKSKKYNIKPICFNNNTVTSIEILESAQKHYKENSEFFFKEVTKTLNHQKREPDEVNRKNMPFYKVASCTSFCIDGKNYNYRDTCFYHYPDKNLIVFFHGCQRKEKEYKKFPDKMKKGFY